MESVCGAHQRALGEFELQKLGRPAGGRQDLPDVVDDARFADLPGGEVDAHQQPQSTGPRRATWAACRHASSSTARPSGTIRPVSSASEMNSSGWEPLTGRQLPPHEGLDTDDLLVAQPDQRLILDDELAAGQRLRDPRGQREPVDVGSVPFGVEHRVAVAAVGLGPVQRGVRGLHQLGRAGRRRRRSARSRRWRTSATSWPPSIVGRRTESSARLRDPLQTLGVRVLVDEDDELVAAHPGHQVTLAGRGRSQSLRDDLQQLIALVMAEGVVDGLEPVEVQIADADRLAGAAAPRPGVGRTRSGWAVRSADRAAPGAADRSAGDTAR